MKNQLMPLFDKVMLRKRSIIETINDQLKNMSQIEHSRHHSEANFVVNLPAGPIAYAFQPKKPALDVDPISSSSLPSLIPQAEVTYHSGLNNKGIWPTN